MGPAYVRQAVDLLEFWKVDENLGYGDKIKKGE